ncbi:MAG: IS630 family transposase, partial [Treponema sp.]|nr:IS630 family transposase [Treponema sp.]
EIELSAMTSQCLNRRIGTLDTLKRELQAWQHERNRNQKTAKWQFTTKDARIKLHSLYPSI